MGAVERCRIGSINAVRYAAWPPCGRPPIVMVHGGSHAGWCWERWARFLSDAGWDCYVFDWLGHGGSAGLPERMAVTRSIQDVAGFELANIVADLDADPIVIGHSMGGLAALTYAAAGGRRLRGLVLVSPVVPMQVQADPIPINVTFGQMFPPPPFPLAKQLFFTTMSETQAQEVYARLEAESPRAVWEATRWTTWVDLAAVRAPVLTMVAAEDMLIPPSSTVGLAAWLRAPVVSIPGVGHSDILMKDEDWQLGAEQVRLWLAGDRAVSTTTAGGR